MVLRGCAKRRNGGPGVSPPEKILKILTSFRGFYHILGISNPAAVPEKGFGGCGSGATVTGRKSCPAGVWGRQPSDAGGYWGLGRSPSRGRRDRVPGRGLGGQSPPIDFLYQEK